MAVLIIAADVGAKAFYLLMIWLASAIGASELSKRKGYGEKWGLGTGLLLSFVGLDHLDLRARPRRVALAPAAGPQGGGRRSGRPRRRAQGLATRGSSGPRARGGDELRVRSG